MEKYSANSVNKRFGSKVGSKTALLLLKQLMDDDGRRCSDGRVLIALFGATVMETVSRSGWLWLVVWVMTACTAVLRKADSQA